MFTNPTFTGSVAGFTMGGNLSFGANTLTTSNTALVSNLNADLLDGFHATAFAASSSLASYLQLAGGTMTGGIINSTSINPLTTLAESWIGPSVTAGIYFKGSNVGIGITSPNSKLEINSDASDVTSELRLSTTNSPSAQYGGLQFNSAGNNSLIIFNKYNSATNVTQIKIASTTIATFQGNGSVGIGTTAPGYKFDVAGTANTDAVRSAMGFDIYQVPDPTVAVTASTTSGGNVTPGVHSYAVTFITATGETHASPNSAAVTVATGTQTVILTIPTSSDPRVTGRKIYRSKNPDYQNFTHYYLDTIPNNASTTYVDTSPDSVLTLYQSDYTRINNTNLGITVNGVKSLTMDKNNTFLGYSAGGSILYAGQNVMIGDLAGRDSTSAFGQTLVGSGAGAYNTTGGANTLIGQYAGRNQTAGSYNTVVGYYSYLGGSGMRNTVIGENGLYTATGNYNVSLGSWAANYQADGTTALTTTSNSIYIGAYSRGYSNADSNSIVIGYQAIGIGANSVVLGNDSITKTALKGSVGIGTTSPGKKLDVVGDGRFSTGLTVSSLGTGALYSNSGVLTNTDPSDINLKQNVLNINNSLSKILQLRPVSFEWKNNGESSQGFIAQEVETVLPELVGQNPGGTKGLYTTRFIPYLVKAIQEQQTMINSLSLSSLNQLVASGGLSVSGHVSFDEDTLGDVKIIAGDKEVKILFKEKYLEKPIITVTPQADLNGSYWVSEVTAEGFSIKLKEAQSSDISFYWHAFAKKGDYFPAPEIIPAIVPGGESTSTSEITPSVVPGSESTSTSEIIPAIVPGGESTSTSEIIPAVDQTLIPDSASIIN